MAVLLALPSTKIDQLSLNLGNILKNQGFLYTFRFQKLAALVYFYQISGQKCFCTYCTVSIRQALHMIVCSQSSAELTSVFQILFLKNALRVWKKSPSSHASARRFHHFYVCQTIMKILSKQERGKTSKKEKPQ